MKLLNMSIKSILIEDDIELELIKEALDNYHYIICDKHPNDPEMQNKIIKLEILCQQFNIPGYEFS